MAQRTRKTVDMMIHTMQHEFSKVLSLNLKPRKEIARAATIPLTNISKHRITVNEPHPPLRG